MLSLYRCKLDQTGTFAVAVSSLQGDGLQFHLLQRPDDVLLLDVAQGALLHTVDALEDDPPLTLGEVLDPPDDDL